MALRSIGLALGNCSVHRKSNRTKTGKLCLGTGSCVLELCFGTEPRELCFGAVSWSCVLEVCLELKAVFGTESCVCFWN